MVSNDGTGAKNPYYSVPVRYTGRIKSFFPDKTFGFVTDHSYRGPGGLKMEVEKPAAITDGGEAGADKVSEQSAGGAAAEAI